MNTNQKELFIKMALNQWKTSTEKIDKIFNSITDAQYKSPVAPGANTTAWILAHLTHANDNLFPLLDISASPYPKLKEIANRKDVAQHEAISKEELSLIWGALNTTLLSKFESMLTEEWFSRHTSVSEEDFKKEPHRNKLNVLLSRTNHQSHHTGQLALLNKASK